MGWRNNNRRIRAGLIAIVFLCAWQATFAGALRDRIIERRVLQAQDDTQDDDAGLPGAASLPAGIRVVRDVAYGSDELQRFDVYGPAQAKSAPVIFMVHGGGWARGDKAMRTVIENKVAHWVPKGFVVISTNYRMLPKTRPIDQAKDVAQAMAAAQGKAADWGGDRARFILMGHSAGAHLAALLAAMPSLASEAGAAPWLGTVLLDSAALDVVQIMQARHLRLYDRAFGSDIAYWIAASPYHALAGQGAPVLAVCSTRRNDPCPQAMQFAAKASSLGMRVAVLEQDLSHRDINQQLGEESRYTAAVDAFLLSVDSSMASRLADR
ncbi:MAG TPA: alpha/beta hydrolase fold domain-containing protein [Burkholderiaceae bacterium]|nr:alpha/beta hydrolase fold domain-containing protein [Burkholderiaceae bacterium]